jgi:hypothetical protein
MGVVRGVSYIGSWTITRFFCLSPCTPACSQTSRIVRLSLRIAFNIASNCCGSRQPSSSDNMVWEENSHPHSMSLMNIRTVTLSPMLRHICRPTMHRQNFNTSIRPIIRTNPYSSLTARGPRCILSIQPSRDKLLLRRPPYRLLSP